ncbi:DUF2834 domain-containing protein [Vibrio sp. SCSIO 43136]|uniref:DUF2834 domain-containing protein n=1 Tax=Vibrio sp. SCSIO 43136 TaxID=2819101 RepID=UPI002074E996|nr:DUF2834 domain-containing protein [Vibrio sp. SCSIO 43136]USD64060.1 DUF2834 domain-containing protein [Vibrio sp. SCSIO 43136]
MTKFYLALTILGVILPYGALVPWLATNGLDGWRLIQDAIANPISTLAWLDILVAAAALIGFIIVDGNRHQVRWRYFAILGTLTVGVSCGLPLYLYLRELQLSQAMEKSKCN